MEMVLVYSNKFPAALNINKKTLPGVFFSFFKKKKFFGHKKKLFIRFWITLRSSVRLINADALVKTDLKNFP